MRYPDRLPTEPTAWLLMLLLFSVTASIIYLVVSSITY